MSYLTKAQVTEIIKNRPSGATPEGVVASLRASGHQLEGLDQPPQQDTRTEGAIPYDRSTFDNPISGLAKFAYNGANNAFQMAKHPQDVISGIANAGLGAAENVVKTYTGYQVPTFKAGGSFGNPGDITNNGPTPEQQAFNGQVQSYYNNYGGQGFKEAGKSAISGDALGTLKGIDKGLTQVNKTLFETPVNATMDYAGAKALASGAFGAAGLKGPAEAVSNFSPASAYAKVAGPVMDPILGSVAETTRQTALIPKIIRNSELAANMNSIIDEGINKGVRPSAAGKTTLAKSQEYTTKARDAVKTIVQNKDNINLVDPNGDVLPHKLPTNLNEFQQALDQTKKQIFNEYNSLQQAAGEKGATVRLDTLVNELDKIANDPSIQDLSPNVAEYARKRANALAVRGEYATPEAQNAIAGLNSKLEAFYKNPGYSDAATAGVDALIANHLREGLDQSVLSATGKQYAPIKAKYGALKAIEKDVSHRTIVAGRQAPAGLIDFGNVFSAGDVINGLMTGGKGLVAKGVLQKVLAEVNRYRNNPNNIVKNMFSKVDSAIHGPSFYEQAAPAVVPTAPEAPAASQTFDTLPGQFTQSDLAKANKKYKASTPPVKQ